MNIVCARDVLNKAVTPALSAVSVKNTVQALDGLLLVANKNNGTLVICGYDLEKGVKVTISGDGAQVNKSGSVIVNAFKFSSIIKNLPEGNVSITADTNFSINIECAGNEFTLHGLDGKIFPLMPDIKGEKSFKLSRNILKNMIASTLFSVAINDSRPALNGAFFEIKNNRLNVVGTDIHRLAVRRSFEGVISDGLNGELDVSFIIPGKSLAELLKLIDDKEKEEPVEIELTKKHVIFSFDNIKYFSRLIETDYVDYRRYIKIDARTSVIINTRSFLESVERAAILADDKKIRVKLSFLKEVNIENRDEAGILLISSASSLGKMSAKCETEIYGDDITIAFNQRYLSDALRVIKDEKILIKLESSIRAIVILPYDGDRDMADADDAKFVYIVVPVRMLD